METIGNDWDSILKEEFEKDYYKKIEEFLEEEYRKKTVFPEREKIFEAFKLTPFKEVKVVILGQDPYHGRGQSHGLAFSVQKDVKIPPSLRNIYKELESDLGLEIPNNGYLKSWAERGVLLLNTALTVREGQANSHRKVGWEIFTDKVIKRINEKEDPVVFILWGNNAKEKEKYITNPIHHVVKSYHPSPLSASRGFFGTRPFSRTNKLLKESGRGPVDWSVEDI